MTEKDKQIAENIKNLLPRLSDHDREIFVAYGEGMASKASRMPNAGEPERK
ncbi:MAG: hypothetical protein K2O84_08970 [Oscillospiraceae bacterium]|nr:hypothetical protein [Oscillospiraceae bacterium]